MASFYCDSNRERVCANHKYTLKPCSKRREPPAYCCVPPYFAVVDDFTQKCLALVADASQIKTTRR